MLACDDSLPDGSWQGLPAYRSMDALWMTGRLPPRIPVAASIVSPPPVAAAHSLPPRSMPTPRPSATPPNAPRTRDTYDACEVDVVHLDAVTTARAALPPVDELERVAGLVALLANASRLRMLLALQPARSPRAELCVCDLALVAGASKSMTSHQLRLLRAAGLVRRRRSGRLTYYRLAGGALLPLLIDLASLATPEASTVAERARGRSTA